VGVSPAVLWPTALIVGAGVVLAGRLAWRARRAPAASGISALIGREVVLRTADGPTGRVLLDGTWWRARSAAAPLSAGQHARVVDLDDLELIVEPIDAGTPDAGTPKETQS
jgi:membrane-bound serine protease (ClpP class)